MNKITKTRIWNRTLADHIDDEHKDARENLRTSFRSVREKVATLVTRIAAIVPSLTQHEISHLDGLWEVADLIVGENYDLNPLEAYVFGVAVLFHDAALCPEAYQGGLDGLRETNQWLDSLVAEKEAGSDSDEAELAADFTALRLLHAQQASKLAEIHWQDPDTKEYVYLIDDLSIRKHLGGLIGEIAASHHWSIEEISSRFSSQFNAPSCFDRDWRVDPIKLACMLRCADAGHINNERAPDFLHALLRRSGVSFNHWQSQNWVSRLDVDSSDGSRETLVLTSTRDFCVEHVKSWWVAYDAATLLEKELRGCNELLEERAQSQPFQIKKLKGAYSPEAMSEFITVNGWKPCLAEIHVSNLEKLISNLGGEKLYGSGVKKDNLEVVIRELVQNSRDSIVARKAIQMDVPGRIEISFRKDGENVWLDVADNGVGMSQRVMFDVLLDFGNSFWASSLVSEEFPGLRASEFKSVGQFGIGFYSIFMAGKTVTLTTRKWTEGLDSLRKLTFEDGVTLRPLFQQGSFEGFPDWASTVVSVCLNERYAQFEQSVEILRNQTNTENLHVPFKDYLSCIVAGLDVPVFFNENSEYIEICDGNISEDTQKVEAWLKSISYVNSQPDNEREINENYIAHNATRLRKIVQDGRLLGFAALSTKVANSMDCLAVNTIGGLAVTAHGRSNDYIGYIEKLPNSAKRDGGEYVASKETLKLWAEEQLAILEEQGLDIIERVVIGSRLCRYMADPINVAIINCRQANGGRIFVEFQWLADYLKKGKLAIYISYLGNQDHAETYCNYEPIEGHLLIIPVGRGEFNNLALDNGVPVEMNSILGCLYRASKNIGIDLMFSIKTSNVKNKFGEVLDYISCELG